MGPKEKKIVAYHEVGHALVTALQKNTEPVQKITIVPRTHGALGYVMQVPEEEKYLNTEKEIRAMLVGFLGGRAAEEIVFDTVTTGASNDIEKATGIIKKMITEYGMNENFGLLNLEELEIKPDVIAKEAVNLSKELCSESYKLMMDNADTLKKIAEALIEKETLTGEEIRKIAGK